MSTKQVKQEVVETNVNQKVTSSIDEMFRVASALSKATIIPKEFVDNPANCYVALEMSQRIGASPMMVMQNLYMVHGKPAWSSSFIIATINTSGRFKTPLQYKMEGKGDSQSCIAYAVSKDGTLCEGPTVTIQMAKDEGWYQKNGSKWKTMPEVMLRYRAAAFFGRQYCPELLMGMHSVEEVYDIPEKDIQVTTESVEEKIKLELASAKQDVIEIDEETGEVQTVEEETPEEAVEVKEPEVKETNPKASYGF